MAQLNDLIVTGSSRFLNGIDLSRTNQLITGTGTAGQDKGSGVSPRYFPTKWTFDTGLELTEGDLFVIKIPVAGISYGVYMSIDNGTTYYPVITQGTTRFTTNIGVNNSIAVIFEPEGSATSIYPINGGDSSTTVTGGAFRVINYYDSNNYVTQTATTTNANYEVLFSATADNTTRTEASRKNSNLKFNPSTGNLQATQLNGVTIGSSPKFTDTDTKVTSADNHYAPATVSGQDKTASASGATAAWSIDVVKGVTLNTDGKGHVTGLSVTSGKIPANPNTNTVPSAYCDTAAATAAKTATCTGYALLSKSYIHVIVVNANTSKTALTLNINGKGAKAIYINGTASSTSNYTLPAGSYLVYYDGTNYYFRTDGKITGDITGDAATVSGNTVGVSVPSSAVFTDANVTQTATTTNANYEVLFAATADNDTRTEGARKNSKLAFNPSTGNLQATQLNGVTIGSSPKFTDSDTKNTAGSTDTSSKIFLIGATSQAANPQTYSDDQVYTTSGTLTSNKISTKAIIALTGSVTAGQDKGSGVSPRYIPSLWTFNSGITVANGEVYFIKIPVAGGTFGVWLSLNNGTNYYPVSIGTSTSRFTTHYGKDMVVAVTYESGLKCSCYAKDGADAVAEVTGRFRILDDYDANTTYSAMSSSELTTGTVTTSRVVRSDYLKTGINSLIDTKIQALDVTTSGAGASKTLTALSETDGKISATFGNISITKSQVSDFPTSMTPSSHTHGNIQNDGTLQTTDITIASGDKLVVTDSSDSSKLARTSIAFDGSTTTTFLSQKGTWETPTNTVPSAICTTAAATAAKVASCNSYVLLSKSYIQVIIGSSNTSATALTLNINSKGAKPIYINGSASSTSNYTLPAGSYLVYYNGTNYYFRTDGKITGNITGDAATVAGHSIASSITSGGTGIVTAGTVYSYIDTMITQALTGSY